MDSTNSKAVLILCKDSLLQRKFHSFNAALIERLGTLIPEARPALQKDLTPILKQKVVEFESLKSFVVNLFSVLAPELSIDPSSFVETNSAELEKASAPFFSLDQFGKSAEVRNVLAALMTKFKLHFVYKTKNSIKQQLIRLLFQEKLGFVSQDALTFEVPSNFKADAIVTAIIPKELEGDFSKVVFYSNLNYSAERKIKQLSGVTMKELGDLSIVSILQLPQKLARIFEEATPGSEESLEPIRIGYAFGPKKLSPFIQTNFLFDKSDTIFVPMDFRVPSLPSVDLIIHKYSNTDPKALNVIELEKAFDEFCAKEYPKLDEREKPVLVDPVHGFEKILSRSQMRDFLWKLAEKPSLREEIQKICMKKGFGEVKIKTPVHIEVPAGKERTESISSVIKESNFNYPVFFKTVNAASTKESHLMGIALTEKGASELEGNPVFQEFDHIIQEVINHDQVVFKVYVLGDLVQINKRKSVPNVDYNPEEVEQHSFFFHSQTPFKEMGIGRSNYKPEEINVDEDIVMAIQKHIHEELGLSLYGLDILRETKSGDYYIVDINYFPGYKEITSFGDVMLEHLKKKSNFRSKIKSV